MGCSRLRAVIALACPCMPDISIETPQRGARYRKLHQTASLRDFLYLKNAKLRNCSCVASSVNLDGAVGGAGDEPLVARLKRHAPHPPQVARQHRLELPRRVPRRLGHLVGSTRRRSRFGGGVRGYLSTRRLVLGRGLGYLFWRAPAQRQRHTACARRAFQRQRVGRAAARRVAAAWVHDERPRIARRRAGPAGRRSSLGHGRRHVLNRSVLARDFGRKLNPVRLGTSARPVRKPKRRGLRIRECRQHRSVTFERRSLGGMVVGEKVKGALRRR